MTISELCFHLQATDCSRSSVHKIVHNVLGFWKLLSRWVPHLLTDEESNGGYPTVFVSLRMRGCRANQAYNHERWDLHPLLHTHEQVTKYDLVWTRGASTEEGQNYSLWRQNYGDYSGIGWAFYSSNTYSLDLRPSDFFPFPQITWWKLVHHQCAA